MSDLKTGDRVMFVLEGAPANGQTATVTKLHHGGCTLVWDSDGEHDFCARHELQHLQPVQG